jgi:hypothetical protein
VLVLRVLALALCLDGHVNLPDRFFFVRCARAAGMPVSRESMLEFRSLEKLFGAGALNTEALTQLFDEHSQPRFSFQFLRARGSDRPPTGGAIGGWWADLITTLLPV